MKGKLLAIVVLVLALVGAIAWWALRGGGTRGLERADHSRAGLQSEAHPQLSTESQPLEARSAEKTEAGAASKTSSLTGGTGTLRIRVLDEKTRAPVPELPFLVFCERGGDHDLAQGKTDKEGRAELRDLEANTILVRTERKAPYAETTGAVWLTAGATQELELLVGPGSTVTGRVVDDLGAPVAGAAVYLNFKSRSTEPPEPDTRSAADGRFCFENVSCRPRGVWVVDGEMRPESWNNVTLTAMSDGVWAGGGAAPTPGKDVVAADIVLDRATTFSGRVVDAVDRPVAGALVSLRSERRWARSHPEWSKDRPEISRGPKDPDFRLLSRETLTDAAGQFELRAPPSGNWIVVWSRADQIQDCFFPEAKPGEHIEGIEFKLKGLTTLELELVDAAGAPAQIPAAFMRLAGLQLGSEAVSALARSSDAAFVHGESAARDPDGNWRVQLLIDPASIGELEIGACGYERVTERSASGFPALVERRIELRECPCFHLRLVAKDPAAKRPESPGRIQVHICRANPKQHAGTTFGCCGYGVRWNGDWSGEPLALVLPVRRKDSFWIYACAQSPSSDKWYELADIASFGPFEPGADEHELALDPAAFVHPPKEERKPPAPSAAGGEAKSRLRGRVTDAATGKALEKSWIQFEEPGVASPFRRTFQRETNAEGEFADEALPVGKWVAHVDHRGYKPADLGLRESRSGETLDLGTIALEAYPVHRGRVLTADGEPPKRAMVFVIDPSLPMPETNRQTQAKPDGSFELFGDLPPKLVLQVLVTALSDGRGAEVQRFVLENWSVDEAKELRFVQSRKVLVTLAGVEPDEATLRPYVCPAPGEPSSNCDHHAGALKDHVELVEGIDIDSSAQGQRYAFLLAPGRYQIYGANILHELAWTEFEVTAGTSDMELTVGVK